MNRWMALFLCQIVGWGGLFAQESRPSADLEREFRDLEAAFEKDVRVAGEKAAAIKEIPDRENNLLESFQARVKNFLPKYRDLALRSQGTSVELSALRRVIDVGQRDKNGRVVVEEAMARVLETKLDLPDVEDICVSVRFLTWLIPEKGVLDWLGQVAAKSPIPDAKAAALFHAASIETEYRSPDPKKRERLLAIYKRVRDEHASTTYAELAAGYIFDLEHLQVGMTAPDFAAQDEKGASFKLSDYRGKTVLLFFWGGWCPTCASILPKIADFETKFPESKFALIGVNSDGPREKIAPVFDRAGVRFRNAMDESTAGPLHKAWNIYAWPMIFLIDSEGVIRARHLRDRELFDACSRLVVGETPESRPGR